MFKHIVGPGVAHMAACALMFAAAPVAATDAVFEISPPASGWESIVKFDLGVQVAAVTSVSITADGTATLGTYGRACPGYPPVTCEDPIISMRRWSVIVSDDESLGSMWAAGSWLAQWDGPFSINEMLDGGGGGFLADGKGVIRYDDEGSYFDSMLVQHCAEQGCSCTGCARGGLIFTAPILVTITYDPAVPVPTDSWGRLKALYR